MQDALLCVKGNTTGEIQHQLEHILMGHPPRLREGRSRALTLAIHFSDHSDLLAKAEKAHDGIHQWDTVHDPDGIFFEPEPWGESRMAFLFPGQGSQFAGMLSFFQDALPGFDRELEEINRLWSTMDDRNMLEIIHGNSGPLNGKALLLTQNAQPAIGFMSEALASFLSRINIRPRFLAGHSFGELSALRAAGALSRSAFLELSRERGLLLAEAGDKIPGAMISIMAPQDTVKHVLDEVQGFITVSNLNSPTQTVVAGETQAIEATEELCKTRGIRTVRLHTSCAFHSSLMGPARDRWKTYLQGRFHSDRGFRAPAPDTVFSNVTATPYPDDREAVVELLDEQIVSPVRWSETCEHLYERGARIFMEVGPGGVLTGLLPKIFQDKPYLGLTCNRKGRDTVPDFLNLLAILASHGVPVKWQQFYRPGEEDQQPVEKHFFQQALQKCPDARRTEKMPVNGNGTRERPEKETTPLAPHALTSFIEGNQQALNNFFQFQESLLERATQGLQGESLSNLLGRLMENNQNVMNDFMSVQETLARGVLQQGDTFAPLQGPPVPAVPSPLGSPLPPVEQPCLSTGPSEARPQHQEEPEDSLEALEAWVRDEICELTGFPPEMVRQDTLFDTDLGLDSITLVQVVVTTMERFPQLNQLGGNVRKIRSIETLLTLVREHGLFQDVHTGETKKPEPFETVVTRAPQQTLSEEDGRLWAGLRAWLVQRLASFSPKPADAIGDTSDFFKELGIDLFTFEGIVEELRHKAPDLGIAGRAMLNTRNLEELGAIAAGILEPGSPESSDRSTRVPVPAPEEPSETVQRFVLREAPYPLSNTPDRTKLPGQILLAGCRGAAFTHFCQELHAAGTRVTQACLDPNGWEVTRENQTVRMPLDDVDGLTKALQSSPEGNLVPAVLFLAMPSSDLQDHAKTPPWEMDLEYAATSLFVLSKALLAGRNEAKVQGELFAVIGAHNATPAWHAAAGVARSLSREWPDVNVCYATLDGRAETFSVKSLLMHLLAKPKDEELIFRPDRIRCLSLSPSPLDKGLATASEPSLNPDSVLLLLGGGTGITAAMGSMLAERYGCRIAAVGRTPWPEETPWADIQDDAALKKRIFEEFVEKAGTNGSSLQDKAQRVQRRFARIKRQRALLQTQAEVERKGGSFHYYHADATRRDELEKVLATIREELGPICGCIHGAGIISDGLVSTKDLNVFRSVLRTKAHSLFHLYDLLRDDPLHFVVLLSSLTSYSGTPGQTDYAAANEVLNAFAGFWNDRVAYPVKSLLYSVWSETGLAGAVINEGMSRLGLAGISTSDGIRLTHEEIVNAPKSDDWVLLTPPSTLRYVTQYNR